MLLQATMLLPCHEPVHERTSNPGPADASRVCMQMLVDIGMTSAQVRHAVLVYRLMLCCIL